MEFGRHLRILFAAAVLCGLGAFSQTGQSGASDSAVVSSTPTATPADTQHAQAQATPIPDSEAKKALAEDTQRLLKLANELNAAVNKSSQNTLSLEVIRKAEEIEKLAKQVKEKMKGEH